MKSIFGDYIDIFKVDDIPTVLGMRIQFHKDSMKEFGPDNSIYIAFDLADAKEFANKMNKATNTFVLGKNG